MNTCLRNWEVEAALDGRISGQALTELDLHVDHCPSCANERRSLYSIRTALLESARAHAPDPLTLRRIRNSALRRADAAIKSPPPRRRPTHALVAAVLVSLATAILYRVVSNTEPVATLVDVYAAPNASWSSRIEGGAKTVELRDGTIDVVVHRKPGDPQVLVFVPDGVIEDVGTTFTVSVVGGNTESIRVREGAVVFTKHDEAPIRVEAGSFWMAPPRVREVASATACLSPSSESVPVDRVKRPLGLKQETSAPPRPTQIPANEASAVPSVGPPSPSGAEEDTAYLRVITLLREGRRGEAKSAAGQYLHDYPDGFRRPEIERILQADSPPGR